MQHTKALSNTSTPSPRAIAARIRCSMVCVLPAPTLPQISQCRVSRSRLAGRPGKNSNPRPESPALRIARPAWKNRAAQSGAREQPPAAQHPKPADGQGGRTSAKPKAEARVKAPAASRPQ